MRPTRLGACLLALTLGPLLGGCLATGPSTRFYVLTPAVEPQPGAIRTAAAPTARLFVVTDVSLPSYLDRPQIVTRDAGNRLTWAETEQWGGPLGEDLARVLAMNLGRLMEGDRVVAAPYAAPRAPDYRIALQIRSFERQTQGRVELTAQWWVIRAGDGALVVDAEQTFLGEPLAGASYDGLVGAMSAVYGDLAKAIARSLQAQAPRAL